MNKKTLLILSLLIIILAWGLISPQGLRAAIANNIWSITFINHFYSGQSIDSNLPLPPSTHTQAGLFLSSLNTHQAKYDQALADLVPLVESDDPLAMRNYANILYFQQKYSDAFKVWEEMGEKLPLLEAVGELHRMHRKDLVVLAYQSLYTIDPEEFAAQFSYLLIEKKDYSTASEILQNAMNEFPNAKDYEKWLNLLAQIKP